MGADDKKPVGLGTVFLQTQSSLIKIMAAGGPVFRRATVPVALVGVSPTRICGCTFIKPLQSLFYRTSEFGSVIGRLGFWDDWTESTVVIG